jgi:flagellar biosynthesis protein FlhG
VRGLTSLEGPSWRRLVEAVDEAALDLDFLLFDTASGISDNVFDVIGLTDYAVVVTSNDPAAVVDAYAVLKLINATDPGKPFGLVVNAVRDAEEATLVFRQIALATERFLGRALRNDGHVLEDRAIRDAGLAQTTVIGGDAPGPAVHCIRRIASRLAAWRPSGAGPWPARPVPVPVPTPDSMEASRCA